MLSLPPLDLASLEAAAACGKLRSWLVAFWQQVATHAGVGLEKGVGNPKNSFFPFGLLLKPPEKGHPPTNSQGTPAFPGFPEDPFPFKGTPESQAPCSSVGKVPHFVVGSNRKPKKEHSGARFLWSDSQKRTHPCTALPKQTHNHDERHSRLEVSCFPYLQS